jgi:hypothetical protein
VFVNNTNSILGGTKFNVGNNSLSGLTIGATNAGASGFDARISEVIIFNRVLNVNERKEIFNYLAKKYKIQVVGV